MTLTPGSVSIIGSACRLPGAAARDAMWRVLHEGRCTVGEVPEARWSSLSFHHPDGGPGRTYTRRAGVLDDPWGFDAGYFGISPREAEQMDPQQRLLLQTVAHAFDDAGLDPLRLSGPRTGVFVGASSSDHSTTALQDPGMVGPQFMLGNTLSILANRISYQWDLGGPSYTVDTACSSSLFALDQAVRAIADGTIDTAVVGGVNMLLSPLPFIGFAQAGMLSPDGLCRSFGAGGNGYVRAEGAVVMILRRTDLARAEEDRIRAEVVALGTNNDGRTAGLALPSADSQIRLLDDVLSSSRFDPDDLAFVEAHGTGTEVGDPLEAAALGTVYGQRRRERLPLGSCKSNFGHLEPAAGLAGLLKAQLALENGAVPVTLHVDRPNPAIDFDGLNLTLVRNRPVAIPDRDRPWLAAINAFGFGGANAHVVIRQPDRTPARRAPAPVPMPPNLMLTAASPPALRALAQEWRAGADDPGRSLARQVSTANHRIARHRMRLVLPAGDRDRLAASLDAWLSGEGAGVGVAEAVSGLRAAPVAFVFSGNGSQWIGMGRHLYGTDPDFRTTFDAIAAEFRALGGADPALLLVADGADGGLARTSAAQPLLFTLQLALVDALGAMGVTPDAVIGHSVGEVAAAVVAGRIARRTGVAIVHERSRIIEALHGTGTMAAVETDRDTLDGLLEGLEADIAAVNAPRSHTVSCSAGPVAAVLKRARASRIVAKRLDIAYPFHSGMMDDVRERLLDALGDIESGPGTLPFISTARPGLADADPLDSRYWWENARAPVQFANGIEALARDGAGVFLEISPRSVLGGYMRAALAASASDAMVLGTLEKSRPDTHDAARIARGVLAAGGRLDEHPTLGAPAGRPSPPPTYPFDEAAYELRPERGVDLFARGRTHPLLGNRPLRDADLWRASWSLATHPWLADHKVRGQIVVPATVMLEALLAAACEVTGQTAFELRDLQIQRPLRLSETGISEIRVRFVPGARVLHLETLVGESWAPLASAGLYQSAAPDRDVAPAVIEMADTTALYRGLEAAGLDYGPEFRRVAAIGLRPDRAVVRIAPPAGTMGFIADPRSVDAGLHPVAALLAAAGGDRDTLFVPHRIGRVRYYGDARLELANLVLGNHGAEAVTVDVKYFGAGGALQLELQDLRLEAAAASAGVSAGYWQEVMVPAAKDRSGAGLMETRVPGDGVQDDIQDVDVIRDALAGRLAWDLLSDAASKDDDPRGKDARKALLAAGIALAENGRIPDGVECPWPSVEMLLQVLAISEPGAHGLLRLTLLAMNGPDAAPDSVWRDTPLVEAACDWLNTLSFRKDRRILCVGPGDKALIDALTHAGGYVTLAIGPNDRAPERDLAGGGRGFLRVTTLEKALADGGYDLILGIGLSHRAEAADIGRVLAPRMAGAAKLLLTEHERDLFAVMAHLHDASSEDRLAAIRRACARLAGDAEDIAGTRTVSGIRMIELAARAQGPDPVRVPVMWIDGEGPLALALRNVAADPDVDADAHDPGTVPDAVVLLCQPDGRSVSERAAMLIARLQTLPEADAPVWCISDRPSDWPLLRGIRRVAANETGRDIRAAVLQGAAASRRFAGIVVSRAPEEELVVTGNDAQTPRVVPAKLSPPPVKGAFRSQLRLGRRGVIGSLEWQRTARRAPQGDEIEIETRAAALNFRDVMWAQGRLPSEALEGSFSGTGLGMECAGRVVRAGPDAPFRNGDEVIAFAPDALASHVTVPGDWALAVPEGHDPVAAATIPVAFLTAEYALSELARIKPGENVLVHGGAGGVGQAAIQIANAAGARVLATAGSPEKRRFLQAMGAACVLDSRSMDFEDGVRHLTEGRGADVVLNTLPNEAMERSLAALAPFGRFVELGKRDFYENTPLPMRVLRRNVQYFAVDADQLLLHRPDLVRRTMSRIADGFRSDHYSPLPFRMFPQASVQDAFETMSAGGHLGKILIEPAKAMASPSVDIGNAGPIEGAWLVTGGTGGFGLETAAYLARRGAGTLWLVSRSGELDAADRLRLEALGAKVEVVAADVADPDAVGALCSRIGTECGSLGGLVHAAMVLDDAPLRDLDAKRIDRVLRPKLDGARLLDRATRRLAPKHFWMYSSISARYGNHGQAAYAIANLGLEALAGARRAEGLAALTIGWGPIADAGYLSRTPAMREIIQRQLGRMLSADEAFVALDRVLASGFDGPSITIALPQWDRLAGEFRVLSGPLFEVVDPRPDAAGGASFDLIRRVAEVGLEAARAEVLAILVAETARILRTAPEAVEPGRPLQELGFDSLMGMNLKLALEERLNADFPMTSISEGPSLNRIALDLVKAAAAGRGQSSTGTVMEGRHLTEIEVPEDVRAQVLRNAARSGRAQTS